MNDTDVAALLERRTPLILAVSLGVSLLAHVALLWRITSGEPLTPPRSEPPLAEEIVLETLGLVSERQVEERKTGEASERTSSAHLQAISNRTPRPSSPPPETTKKAEADDNPYAPSPEPPSAMVPEEGAGATRVKPSEAPESISEARGGPVPAAQETPKRGGGSADMDQIARTIQAPDPTDPAVLRQYVIELRRVIQSRLVYPPEARAASMVGAPVIRFTVSVGGDILPGSLTVVRSCGFPLLDDHALKAARESAPLPPPPRQMTVSIAVAFVRDPQ